jgi:hypothetical protein
MANKFIDQQEVAVLLGVRGDDYITDEEAEITLKRVYGNDMRVLSVDGGYVLYDGVSKRIMIDGESIDLDDIGAKETWE